MNAAEIEALFAKTLGDDDSASQAFSVLRADGSRQVFDHAAAWCVSGDSKKRASAVAVLCLLREGTFRQEAYGLIAAMLATEEDPLALDSAIRALGPLDDARAVPAVLPFSAHPDARIRLTVAVALGSYSNDARSAEGLLMLVSDPLADVRDWAVFGLGVLGDADSPEIREALLRCLDDANEDVREEAAVGLARRRDERLAPKLKAMLDQPELKLRVAEAAAALLGFDADPPDWEAADYKTAIAGRFERTRDRPRPSN